MRKQHSLDHSEFIDYVYSCLMGEFRNSPWKIVLIQFNFLLNYIARLGSE